MTRKAHHDAVLMTNHLKVSNVVCCGSYLATCMFMGSDSECHQTEGVLYCYIQRAGVSNILGGRQSPEVPLIEILLFRGRYSSWRWKHVVNKSVKGSIRFSVNTSLHCNLTLGVNDEDLSLYREVIRRAPHEFKIACLEDIRDLFPPDQNPFYAGFGNRDTDELSYLKMGIPQGKIFIINPKGEVAVQRRVDRKSYASLHTLVHDMFPPPTTVSSSEQEDFNQWNFWRLPPLENV